MIVSVKETIFDTVDDLVSDFLYYDRKEDDQLSRDVLESMIASGEVTVAEITERFQQALMKGIN
jgi:hypothetical protein